MSPLMCLHTSDVNYQSERVFKGSRDFSIISTRLSVPICLSLCVCVVHRVLMDTLSPAGGLATTLNLHRMQLMENGISFIDRVRIEGRGRRSRPGAKVGGVGTVFLLMSSLLRIQFIILLTLLRPSFLLVACCYTVNEESNKYSRFSD